MGIVICNDKIKDNAWKDIILFLFDRINELLRIVPNSSNLIISKLSLFDNNEFQPFWGWESQINYKNYLNYAINSMFENERKILANICIKCGIDKGPPPSLTVHPAYCEKCRSQFVPEDYKDNVIVCMSGKAGSGKDTVADYLVSKHGFQRMAFADPLRDIVQLVFVLDHDSVWDRKLREFPLKNLPNYIELGKICGSEFISNKTAIESVGNIKDENYWSVRKLLQFIGTEMFRNLINRDTWVMNFTQRMEPGVNYVISDCRFLNEYEWIKNKFGGKILFLDIIRKGCDGVKVGLENHESERYKLPSDITIENNGTLEELYIKITNLIMSTLKI